MKCTWGLAAYRPAAEPVATIGNFDGLHQGHLALLGAVVRAARARRGTSVLLTFEPHPVTVLHPGADIRFLTSLEEKLGLLQRTGLDDVVFLRFDAAFAALTPADFVFRVLRDAVGVREVFVGEHFAFGTGRAGRIGDLQRFGGEAGIAVHAVPPVQIDAQVVSSSRIRALLQRGDVRGANRLLGRTYRLSGRVVRGAQRGAALGWPTANLRLPDQRVIPPDGVYATRVEHDGTAYDSVSYIGTRPTFGAGERLLEVSILDRQVDLYGARLHIDFLDRLRGDMTFESGEALSAQISRDIEDARAMFRAAEHAAPER